MGSEAARREERAVQSIDALFNDASVPAIETWRALGRLADQIQLLRETLNIKPGTSEEDDDAEEE